MSYTKLGFEDGQVLEAEHLNHIEEGLANALAPTYAEEATEIIPEQEVELTGEVIVCCELPYHYGILEPYQFVDITWDGVLYENVPRIFNEDLGTDDYVAFNLTFDDGSGIAITGMCDSSTLTQNLLLMGNTAGTHTISVKVKKITPVPQCLLQYKVRKYMFSISNTDGTLSGTTFTMSADKKAQVAEIIADMATLPNILNIGCNVHIAGSRALTASLSLMSSWVGFTVATGTTADTGGFGNDVIQYSDTDTLSMMVNYGSTFYITVMYAE